MKPYLTGRAAPAAPMTPGAAERRAPASPEVRSTKTWSLGRESSRKRTATVQGVEAAKQMIRLRRSVWDRKKKLSVPRPQQMQVNSTRNTTNSIESTPLFKNTGSFQQKMGLRVFRLPGSGRFIFFFNTRGTSEDNLQRGSLL